MNTQPEALRLADADIESIIKANMMLSINFAGIKNDIAIHIDDELRRLHEVNQELLEALKDVMYWENGKPEWDVARAAIAKATGEQA